MPYLWTAIARRQDEDDPRKGSPRHQARKHSRTRFVTCARTMDTPKGAKSDCCLKGANTQNVPKPPMEGLIGHLVNDPFMDTTARRQDEDDPRKGVASSPS